MNKKTTSYYALFLLIFSLSIVARPSGLGINISLPEQGGTFVDVVKENHRWLNTGSWAALEEGDFDEQGWPTLDAIFLIDARPVAEWAGEIDDPDEYRIDWSGIYSCSITGKANVQSWGEGTVRNVVYDSDNNKTTFELEVSEPDGDNYGFFAIAFLETQRTPDDDQITGFTNLKMIRPDYEPDTEQTFTDDFIAALTNPPFATIRFKDFLGTDSGDPEYPGVTEWSDRKLPTDASQERIEEIGKKSGAAWEYVIELANLVHIDPWINVPVSATTGYITELAKMFKEQLNPDLNIYVESSNEVWNTAPAFQQSQYNQAQAKELGIGEHSNHIRRTVEIAQIFESVFGTGSLNNKIRVVLCSHAPMLKWWVQPMLDYCQKNLAEPSQYIYALACQTYFSGGADAGESVDKILEDCRNSITAQMDEKSGNQAGRKQWIKTTNDFGLLGGFFSYEGGPDHGGGSTTNLDNRIDAERSTGMAEVYKYNFNEGFFQLGGNIAVQFTLTSSYNRYGCWGLTDDITEPDRNHKFQAARELIAASSVKSNKNVAEYLLTANYPNPFNPQTTIRFALPFPQAVTLEIFDVTGKKVKTLADQFYPAGHHRISWDGTDFLNHKVASGLYFYRFRAGAFTETRSMVLLK